MTSDPTPRGGAPTPAADPPDEGQTLLRQPRRWWVWLPRVWIVVVAVSVASGVTRLVETTLAAQSTGSGFAGPAIVIALTVLVTLVGVVLAWRSTSQPYAGTDTMNALHQSLDHAERRAAARALRRGHAVAPAHRAYAVARTAANRRLFILLGLLPALQWGQVTSAANRELGSGFFWSMTVLAVIMSAVTAGVALMQLQAERSLRAPVP